MIVYRQEEDCFIKLWPFYIIVNQILLVDLTAINKYVAVRDIKILNSSRIFFSFDIIRFPYAFTEGVGKKKRLKIHCAKGVI